MSNLTNNTAELNKILAAVNALPEAGGGGSSGGASSDYEIIEGTITPASDSQQIRIPWGKETLPVFYAVVRQDFDTYVTPENPATGAVVGGIVQFASGYMRVSSAVTNRYAGLRLTATSKHTGYTGGLTSFPNANDILTEDGLVADTSSTAYKWQSSETYKYYIVDKVVG